MINNRKALVVGINDYPSVPLSGCIIRCRCFIIY